MLVENIFQKMKSYIHGGLIEIEIGKNQIEEEGLIILWFQKIWKLV